MASGEESVVVDVADDASVVVVDVADVVDVVVAADVVVDADVVAANALAPFVTSQPPAHPNHHRPSPPPGVVALPQPRLAALVAAPLLPTSHPMSGNTCCSSSRSLCKP